MSGIRQPSLALSAQNLSFAQQPFVGGPVQYGNFQSQANRAAAGPQSFNAGIPYQSNAEMERKAQKTREFEQQRMKLQQWNNGKREGPAMEKMIAQIVGNPLAAASFASGNRPHTAAGAGTAGGQHFVANSGSFARDPNANDIKHSSYFSSLPPFNPSDGCSHSFQVSFQAHSQNLDKAVQRVSDVQSGSGKYPSHSSHGDPSNLHGMIPVTGVFMTPNFPSENHLYSNSNPPHFPMPQWTRDKAKLPAEYTNYYHLCLASSRPHGVDTPDTGLVYVLLRSSGLSNDILGAIWAVTNRSQPGQLTKEEFFTALALVALAQETGTIASWNVLCSLSKPPVPHLSLTALNVPPVTTYSTATSPSFGPPVHVTRQVSSGGLPNHKVEPAPAPAPAAASVFTTSSTASNDDFGEFTDFQTALPATATDKDDMVSDQNLDKYGALRALAGSTDSADNEKQSVENGSMSDDVPGASKCTNQTDFTKWPGTNDHRGDSTLPRPVSNAFAAPNSATNGELFPVPPLANGTSPPTSVHVGSKAFPRDVSFHKKDLNELLRQTCASLDTWPANNVGGTKSEEDSSSIRSGSKEPSIHSLELASIKQFDLDQEPADMENHIAQVPESRPAWSRAGSVSLVDRYAAFREESNGTKESSAEKHVDAWTKCLDVCLHLVKQAEKIFSEAEDEAIRKEMLDTERGSKFLSGIVQIYRVYRRIRLSLQTTAFQTDNLIEMLTAIEATWTKLSELVGFSGIMPPPEKVDFRNAVIQSSKETNEQHVACCGVCLLNVDATCKTDHGISFDYKLTYGGRQYHAQCANLWINCIDSILPALDIPSLL